MAARPLPGAHTGARQRRNMIAVPLAPPARCRALHYAGSMAITRQDLETDRLRTSLCSTPVASALLPVEAFEQTLRDALAARPDDRTLKGDVWVFGYGSLIWNPMVVHTERRRATVHGYHRGFYLYSRINRGSWDNPGLVLGLDRGGCCHGMVFRIPGHMVEQEFRLLWRREMLTGAYHPRWLRIRSGEARRGWPRAARACLRHEPRARRLCRTPSRCQRGGTAAPCRRPLWPGARILATDAAGPCHQRRRRPLSRPAVAPAPGP